jgi:signal transduction histidine kinase
MRAAEINRLADSVEQAQDRVLVVDDEPKALAISRDILAMDGFAVMTARDGREALKLFVRERPDAVITDIRMPDVGGLDLLEMIRAVDEDVPVIIVTGYATLETATKAVARGAFEYLFKPVDFDKLRATLRRALDRHRLVRENRRLLRELAEANARLGNVNVELKSEVAARTRELALERDLLAQIHAAVPVALAVVAAGRGEPGEAAVLRANAAWERLGAAEGVLRAALAGEIALVAGGECVRDRRVALESGGAGRVFEASILPLAGGRALVVAQDLTERSRLEEELVQAEKLSSLGMLAGGIVHDLSNPLSAVLGTAQLLEDEVGAALQGEVQAIITSARYMRAVCLGLNDFARRARPGEELPVDVNELCEKALALAGYAKKLIDVRLERRFEPGVPPVRANPNELLQVIVNLIVNAADAAPRGRIAVATRREAPDRVALAVTDDGPGIADSLRARIFEPFFTTKGPGKGTGLGLYISRRIVLRLGGEISLASRPGETTFTVVLPAVLDAEAM